MYKKVPKASKNMEKPHRIPVIHVKSEPIEIPVKNLNIRFSEEDWKGIEKLLRENKGGS
jgi:hypothetical protein